MHGERELFIKSNTYGTFVLFPHAFSQKGADNHKLTGSLNWARVEAVKTSDNRWRHSPSPRSPSTSGTCEAPSSASRTSDKTKWKDITHGQI